MTENNINRAMCYLRRALERVHGEGQIMCHIDTAIHLLRNERNKCDAATAYEAVETENGFELVPVELGEVVHKS